MSDKKLTQLGQVSSVGGDDILYVVQNNETDGKVTTDQIKNFVKNGLSKNDVGLTNVDNTTDVDKPISTLTQNALNLKQDTLVSGTTIKTLNGQSVLGAGNIDVGAAIESTYTVVTRNGSIANQVHSFGINNQTSFGFDAFALREEAGLTNQTVVRETFDVESSVNYDQTGDLVWNGVVRPIAHPSTVPVNNQVGDYFYSTDQTHGDHPIIIRQDNAKNTEKLTGNSSPAGYSATASSFYDGLPEIYHAFDGLSGGNASWFSAKNSAFPQWVQIEYPTPRFFTSYDIVSRTTPTPSYVNSPNSWELRGSNDGVNFTTIHSVTNDTRNQSGLRRSFQISTPGSYKYYRIYVTSSNGNDYVAISEVDFYAVSPITLVGADFSIFTVDEDGVLVASTDQWDWFGGRIPDTSLLIEPFKIRSQAPTTTSLTIIPFSQIAIQKSLTSLSAYSRINSATVTATQTANGKVRLAVSRDLIDWFAWDGTSWAALGTLTNDTSSAEAVIANGMSPATVGGLRFEQWELLFPGGKPDKIAFAYALDVPNPQTDVASIDTVSLNVNFVSAWLQQTSAQVEIRWYNEAVTFKTVNAGNYKLAYQAPA